MPLREQYTAATLWSGIDIVVRQSLAFAGSVVLARLLNPDQFGTIALLSLFIGISGVFVDGGFSAALIQRKDITHTDESTVFWLNLGMGLLVGTLLWMLAPALARFCSKPILVSLAPIFAVNVIVIAAGAIHCTLLSKRLDFIAQMQTGVVATVISGTSAIIMARMGFGIWSLAAQTLISSTTTTLLLWYATGWRPALVFSLKSVQVLFSFGSHMFGAAVLNVAHAQSFRLLIGQLYGVRDLAFFDRADSTTQIPVGMLTSIFSRVTLPIFSRAAGEGGMLQQATRLAIRNIMYINLPLTLGLAAMAKPLVLLLFGEAWLPAVPIMRVLCLAASIWPPITINLCAVAAVGHSGLFLRLQVATKSFGCFCLVIGSFFGIPGIVWGQLGSNLFAFTLSGYCAQRYTQYRFAQQLRDCLPPCLISAFVVAIGSYVSTLLPR